MTNFKTKLEKSMNLQLIVAGVSGLVDNEGYTPHEAWRLVEEVKKNIFPALMEMSRDNNV